MKTIRMRVWGAILGVWWLAGCGSNANLGQFSSSIDSKTGLAQLTMQQQLTLCNEVAMFSQSSGLQQDSQELLCRESAILAVYLTAPDGATDAQLRASCQSSYDTCKPALSPAACSYMPLTAACTATVADLSACINDMVTASQMSLKVIPTCAEVNAATFQTSGPPGPAEPASCTSYAQKCPTQTMI